jgi:hypothetical protein
MSPLKSRVNVVAAIAGILVTLAIAFLLMSLTTAMGYWSYQPDEMAMLDSTSWTIASFVWTISVFIGAWITVMMAGSKNAKSGILNALTAWAGSYILFGGITMNIVESNARSFFGAAQIGLNWHGFLGDAAALAAAIVAGAFAVRFERAPRTVKPRAEEVKASHAVLTGPMAHQPTPS